MMAEKTQQLENIQKSKSKISKALTKAIEFVRPVETDPKNVEKVEPICYHAVLASHRQVCSLSVSFIDKYVHSNCKIIILLYVLIITCRGSNTRINHVYKPLQLFRGTKLFCEQQQLKSRQWIFSTWETVFIVIDFSAQSQNLASGW